MKSKQKDGVQVRTRLLRLGWLLVFLLIAGLQIAGIPYRYREILANPRTITSTMESRSEPVIAALAEAGIRGEVYAAYQVGLEILRSFPFLIFAIMIFLYRPLDRGAHLISLLLVLGSTELYSSILIAKFGIRADQLISMINGITLTLIFFLFPDGRFVPRWSKWVMILIMLIGLPAIFFPGSQWDANRIIKDSPIGWMVLILIFGSMLFAPVYRYRRVSGPVERLQTRWVVAGLAALIVLFITQGILLPVLVPSLVAINGENIRYHILINLLILQPLAMILPIGMGISLLRYRLYDLDIIIRKTLVYTVVTGLLALVYFVAVLLPRSLFDRLGTGQSQVAIVLSTLASAALFNPLRRRVQEGVDRRFYRHKYNAEQVLANFAATARDEVDVERLSAALVAAVQQTVQPEGVSLWIRPVEGVARVQPDGTLS